MRKYLVGRLVSCCSMALGWLLVCSCAWAAGAENADPTRPTTAMADQLKARAVDTQAMKLQALVVGTDENGVALLGTAGLGTMPVRKGSQLVENVDGVSVTMKVKSVGVKGVELETASGKAPIFLPGSFTSLAAPTNRPAEFIRHLEATQVPLEQLLRLISDQSGVNISSSAATAKKSVSIFLRNVTAEAAVEEICRTSGLWFRRESGSNILRVTTMDEYAENLNSFREEKTELFTLLYPNVIEIASAIYGIYPDRTLLSLGEEEFDDDAENDLSRRFRRFRVLEDNGGSQFLNMEPPDASSSSGSRTGNGSFSYSQGNGLSRFTQWDQLAGRNRGRNSARYNNLSVLSANEAKALEAARLSGNTNLLNSAKGQAALGQANIFVSISRRNNMLIVRTSDMRVMDEVRALVKRLDVPTPMVLMEVKVLELDITDDFEAGITWSLTDVDRGDGAATHTLGHDGDGLRNIVAQTLAGAQSTFDPTFAFAAVSDHIKADIQLLEKDGKVRTLATPTLLTANNEVSRIFSGKEYPLVTGWTKSETTTSALSSPVVSLPTVEIEKKDVGNMLLITPNINADKTVTLHLLQENSAIADEKVSIPVTGGTGEEKEIEYVESRSLTGTFVAKDGKMVLAGGLISEHESEQYWRTPFLGSVPLLGWLFRGTEKIKRRTELVVLIRPYVISTPMEGGKISAELLNRISAHPARDGRGSMMIHKAKDGKDDAYHPHTAKDDLENLVK